LFLPAILLVINWISHTIHFFKKYYQVDTIILIVPATLVLGVKRWVQNAYCPYILVIVR
jgi:hypothetical protein